LLDVTATLIGLQLHFGGRHENALLDHIEVAFGRPVGEVGRQKEVPPRLGDHHVGPGSSASTAP
jgi:hypothetical protein